MSSAQISEILELIDRDRQEVVHPHMRRETAPGIVRHVSQIEAETKIKYSSVTPTDLEETILRESDLARSRSHLLEWQLHDHDSPAGLANALQNARFDFGPKCAVMVFDLEQQSSLLDAHQPAVDVRRLDDPDRLDDFRTVSAAVWPEHLDGQLQFIQTFLRRFPDYMSVYVAYDQGRPVSNGTQVFHPDSLFSYLVSGATVPEFRRRGFYSALVRARAKDAAERQVRFLRVLAMPTSEPILHGQGFRVISHFRSCELDFSKKEGSEAT